ncbi:hypothetical protein PoB_004314600 [Plakobranchus ocellatus]|uniref:Uncharacterized protein n=1 Tax=Plakobranchus ocellatus TaxID=259542 RepID=A0AAV4B871_9GAST|nr:hypothetical protein PoB_004314600 [Plakobranchus ocellatus]
MVGRRDSTIQWPDGKILQQWLGRDILPYNGQVQRFYHTMVGWRDSTLQWSGREILPYNGRVEIFYHTMAAGKILPYNGWVEIFYHTMFRCRDSTIQ